MTTTPNERMTVCLSYTLHNQPLYEKSLFKLTRHSFQNHNSLNNYLEEAFSRANQLSVLWHFLTYIVSRGTFLFQLRALKYVFFPSESLYMYKLSTVLCYYCIRLFSVKI